MTGAQLFTPLWLRVEVKFNPQGGGGGGNTTQPTANVSVPTAQITVKKISHNAANGDLEKDVQETVGAFLPINNDDDDYDSANQADNAQTGAVTGENDLLPIVLHQVQPSNLGGNYKLTIPSCVKIWPNADKSGTEVTSSTSFSAGQDTTLYVEGMTKNNGVIKLNWDYTDASGQNVSVTDASRVKVTVFDWSGPLNVPGYSIYEYKASGASSSANWTAPTGGTVKSGQDTSDMKILWGEGPTVGKAIYKAQDNYTWDLGVNVVQVKINSSGNSVTMGGPPSQAAATRIRSSSGSPAMLATMNLAINGPSVSGSQRGLKFLQIGFIQNGKVDHLHGNFDAFTPKKMEVSSMDSGGWLLDFLTTSPASTSPWYDYQSATPVGTGKAFYAPVGSTSISSVDMEAADTPQLTGSDKTSLTIGTVTDQIDSLSIQVSFNFYLAVRTTQSQNGSDSVYTQRAKVGWAFNGSGSLNSAMSWTPTGSGLTGGSSMTSVTDGTIVPVTTGSPMNTVGASMTWSVKNQ